MIKQSEFFFFNFKDWRQAMNSNGGQPGSLNFTVDKSNLYREESVTDLKIANIQRLTPVHLDGSEDDGG